MVQQFLVFFILIFFHATAFKYKIFPKSCWNRIQFTVNLVNDGKNNLSPSNLRFSELKSSESMFLKSIRNRSKEKTFISKDERTEVENLLAHHLPKMSGQNIANTAFSLSIIYERSKITSKSEKSLIMRNIPRIINQMNEHDLSSLFVALAKLGTSWSELREIKRIEDIIEENIKKMNHKELGDTIWALADMGSQYSHFSTSCRSTIIDRISHEANRLNLYQLPSILWGFAKMGIRWTDLDKRAQSSLISILQVSSSSINSPSGNILTPQQSSKIIWSLGGIGVKAHEHFSTEFFDEYLVNINGIKKSKMGFAFSSSQTLTGLAKMNVKWESLSQSSKYIVWEQLIRVCQGSNNQGLSNAVWAIGSIEIPIDEMTATQRVILWDSIDKTFPLCTGWELTNMLWGLSKMKVKWYDISESIIENMSNAIVRLAGSMNVVDVAILTYTLGSMDAPIDSMTTTTMVEALFESIVVSLPRMKATQISKIIWGLASVGLSWEQLPESIRWQLNIALRREGSEMTPYDLANSAYALALLSFDNQTPSDPAFRGAHEVMISNMLKFQKKQHELGSVSLKSSKNRNYSIEEIEQLRIFSHYINVMRPDTQSNRFIGGGSSNGHEYIPDEFLVSETDSSSVFKVVSPFPQKDDYRLRLNNGTSSRLQNTIINEINQALAPQNKDGKFRVASEVSSFNGVYPVDAAIYYEEDLVCIVEIDGPQHYRFDGKIRRKDKLKEAMYLRKHPDCLIQRIRWDVANKIGSEVIGLEVINAAIESSKQSGGFNKIWRSVEKSLGGFFNWSLRNER